MKKYQKVYAICEPCKVLVGVVMHKKTFDQLDGHSLVSYELRFLNDEGVATWSELPSTEIFETPAKAFAALESRFEPLLEHILKEEEENGIHQ